jgi:hypothetical protein
MGAAVDDDDGCVCGRGKGAKEKGMTTLPNNIIIYRAAYCVSPPFLPGAPVVLLRFSLCVSAFQFAVTQSPYGKWKKFTGEN